MNDKKYFNITWLLWTAYLIAICAIIFIFHISTTTDLYFTAGQHWLSGLPIYSEHTKFLYFLQTAVLYSYISEMPKWLYEIAWRVLAFALISHGLYRFARLNAYGAQAKFFFCMTILTLILGWQAAVLGDLDLLVLAIMLIVTTELLDERLWLVVFYLVIGFLLAPKVLAMFFAARLAYRSLYWRCIILVLLGMLLPFFFQKVHYVATQFQAMHQMMFEVYHSNNKAWPQLFSLLERGPWHISYTIQNIARVALTIAILLPCYYLQNKFIKPLFCILIYFAATVVILLLNPRTEFMDYVFLAPVLAYFSLATYYEKKWLQLSSLILTTGVLVITQILSQFINPISIAWIPPLCLIGCAIQQVFYFKKCH